MVKLIEQEGKATTCFGKEIKVIREMFHDENKKITYPRTNARNILAEQAQAYEMKLLLPILDLAKKTDEFRMLLAS